ncbi:MAG: hypothetical protein IIC08_05430 [Proteobacteria bacterium]|nr:hypothetical protein [Pseudomonadota bacterium]
MVTGPVERHGARTRRKMQTPCPASKPRRLKNDLRDFNGDDKKPREHCAARRACPNLSFPVKSLDEAKRFLDKSGISHSDEFTLKGMHAIFIRDPGRNVM